MDTSLKKSQVITPLKYTVEISCLTVVFYPEVDLDKRSSIGTLLGFFWGKRGIFTTYCSMRAVVYICGSDYMAYMTASQNAWAQLHVHINHRLR
jgi:hypothetical protein